MLLVVLDDIIIKDIAVVASHLQCRVSHDLLKGERIASAVHQILTSEGVSERIQSFRNCVKMLFVSCYGFVFNSSRCDC